MSSLQHNSPTRGWVACRATKRACRYGSAAHRNIAVSEGLSAHQEAINASMVTGAISSSDASRLGKQITDSIFNSKSVEVITEIDPRIQAKKIKRLNAKLERENEGLMLGFGLRADEVIVNCIVVPEAERGNGMGARVMRSIFEEADKEEWNITLTPSDAYEGEVPRLYEFYKRLGFNENTSGIGKESLIRYPQK